MKVNVFNTVILFIALICLIALGALPVFNNIGFWESNDYALPGFLLLAVASALFYVRQERLLIKSISILVAIGLPLIVIAIVGFVM